MEGIEAVMYGCARNRCEGRVAVGEGSRGLCCFLAPLFDAGCTCIRNREFSRYDTAQSEIRVMNGDPARREAGLLRDDVDEAVR